MADLPTTNVRRLLGAGAGDMRFSAEAVTQGVGAAEEFIRRLGERAASVARGHGMKTIMPEHLEVAKTQLLT
jgi:histone H3/H4